MEQSILNCIWPSKSNDFLDILRAATDYCGIECNVSHNFENFSSFQDNKNTNYIVHSSIVEKTNFRECREFIGEAGIEDKYFMIVYDKCDPQVIGQKEIRDQNILNIEKGKYRLKFSDKINSTADILSGESLDIAISQNQTFAMNDFYFEMSGWLNIAWIEDSYKRIKIPLLIKDKKYNLFSLLNVKVIFEVSDIYYKFLPRILPLVLFLRIVFQDKCWSRKVNQANLVIDDPWLREPYGNLSYKKLLQEMKKHNFHTTIAFIPWNYKKNKRNVVEIIKNNRKYYSIAMHGNNHEHYEFTTYEKVPFSKQKFGIYQAIARMEILRKANGINYDNVMVFPHGICPKETLSLLKKQNLLATANFQINPLNESSSETTNFMLWPANISHHSFPLLKRVTPDIPKSCLLLDMFLNRPIIFYVHQDYFVDGIDRFSEIAAYINGKFKNRIVWCSLAGLTSKLYMERQIHDGIREIRMFSRKIRVYNEMGHDCTYKIKKEYFDFQNIEKIKINNCEYNDTNIFEKEIQLKPKSSLWIEIVYKNIIAEYKKILEDEETGKFDIKLKIKLLRKLSDLRDIYLSRNKFGKKIIQLYYKKK